MLRAHSPTRMSDQQLLRLVKRMVLLLVLGTAAFAIFYYVDRNPDPGLSLVDRQIARAEEAVRAAPENVTARLGLGGLYLTAERYDDAAEQFGQVLTVKPENRLALLGRGRALYALGDVGGARDVLRQLVDLSSAAEFGNVDPTAQEAHFFLGEIATAAQDWSTAVEEYRAALAMEPMDADAWYALGRTYLSAAQPEAAVEPLRRAILFVPVEWREPYVALADAYTALGQTMDAAWARAMATFTGGDSAAARRELEAFAGPDASADVLLGLGLVTETLGDKEAAATWYAKALQKDPESFSAQQGYMRTSGDGLEAPVDKPTGAEGEAAAETDDRDAAVGSVEDRR